MALPEALSTRVRLPAIAAPMTGVSGLELVAAACEAGIIGSFPVHNARRGGLLGWQGVWSAGHSVSGVHGIAPVREVVDALIEQYREARSAWFATAAAHSAA